MEYENELRILKELKKEMLNEKDPKKQVLLISDYYNISAYLDKIGVIDALEEIISLPIKDDLYLKRVEQDKIKYCSEFINYFNLIDDITQKLMLLYKDYPLKNINSFYCNPIDINLGMDLLYSFFDELGDDFYNLFLKMNQEKRISFTSNMYDEGICYNASFKHGPFIVLRKESDNYDYEFLSSLAHEIGHCYEFGLSSDNQSVFPIYLLAETSSYVIQKLFDEFVIKNNIYKEKVMYSKMINQGILYERLLVNDFVNKVLDNDLVETIDYEYGLFLISNDDLIKKYHYPRLMDALNNYPPMIENYLYVLSDVVANNIVRIYRSDKKEGLRLFKDFIKNGKKDSFASNMKLYGNNLDEMQDVIKEVYSYQKKMGY